MLIFNEYIGVGKELKLGVIVLREEGLKIKAAGVPSKIGGDITNL
jgi:hypothetical protein